MSDVRLPPNLSQQHLMVNNDDRNGSTATMTSREKSNSMDNNNSLSKITAMEWLTVIVLCYINLINYMDRFTVAGMYFYLFFIYIKNKLLPS